MDNRLEVEFFGGEERKSVGEVESHLVAKNGTSAGAGAVGLVDAIVADVAEKVEILFHDSVVGVTEEVEDEEDEDGEEVCIRGSASRWRVVV